MPVYDYLPFPKGLIVGIRQLVSLGFEFAHSGAAWNRDHRCARDGDCPHTLRTNVDGDCLMFKFTGDTVMRAEDCNNALITT